MAEAAAARYLRMPHVERRMQVGLFGGSPPLTQYPNLLALEPPGGARYRIDRMAEIPLATAGGAVLRLLAERPAHVAR